MAEFLINTERVLNMYLFNIKRRISMNFTINIEIKFVHKEVGLVPDDVILNVFEYGQDMILDIFSILKNSYRLISD